MSVDREAVQAVAGVLADKGCVVTDVVGMVRFVAEDGTQSYLFMLDGAEVSGANMIVAAGMVRALDTYVDSHLRGKFSKR